MPSGFSVQPVAFSASAGLIHRPSRAATVVSLVGVRMVVMVTSSSTTDYLGTEIETSFEVMNSSRTGTPFLVCSMPRLMAGMISSVLVTRSP